jgi:hypothetical protein
VRVVPAAATDRGAPVEESLRMNIMPILCRRRSAGISHNIAQERQAKRRSRLLQFSMVEPSKQRSSALLTMPEIQPGTRPQWPHFSALAEI